MGIPPRKPPAHAKAFLEFFINGTVLSAILPIFYGLRDSLPDNWIGILGASMDQQTEINMTRQLSGLFDISHG